MSALTRGFRICGLPELDCTNDKPIPGLYAAGESTGGVHGAVRLGSCAVLDCLVNGRIVGEDAGKSAA